MGETHKDSQKLGHHCDRRGRSSRSDSLVDPLPSTCLLAAVRIVGESQLGPCALALTRMARVPQEASLEVARALVGVLVQKGSSGDEGGGRDGLWMGCS
jgi:hypothetical protein